MTNLPTTPASAVSAVIASELPMVTRTGHAHHDEQERHEQERAARAHEPGAETDPEGDQRRQRRLNRTLLAGVSGVRLRRWART